jgi:hypothetical protein
MIDQAQQREVDHVIAAALREQADAEKYRRHQRRARAGGAGASDGARPLEFDESGFPVPQRTPGFVQRVTRLLSLY